MVRTAVREMLDKLETLQHVERVNRWSRGSCDMCGAYGGVLLIETEHSDKLVCFDHALKHHYIY